jgi:pyruvate formate lyase activating enzyme
MKITAAPKKETLIDYPDKIACMIFTPGCNYQCPACHSRHVVFGEPSVSEEEVFQHLSERKGWLDGIVICGGEPTLQHTLPHFLEEVRKRFPKLSVKLDTNGSNWHMLGRIYERKLADYVAMDIKGPYSNGMYRKLTGVDKMGDDVVIDERDGLTKAMAVVANFPGHEFRTTVVPISRDDGTISFMTPEEIGETADFIYRNLPNNDSSYFLQRFVARGADEMMDSRFAKENLPEGLRETPKELMQKALEEARKYLPNAKIRGE